jgi:maltooligosyltrehalose trehalohydrolase
MTKNDYAFGPRIDEGRTEFRLWAPGAMQAELLLEGAAPVPMEKREDGFHIATVNAGAGARYKFRIGELEFPDLASRQQAGSTRDWSVVTEQLTPPPEWTRPWHETMIAEIHVGTATPEGTFRALADRLEHFRDAGYTCLEIMPVNQFPGTRNWGYDGTLIFAPASAYGTRTDLRDLVARAHEVGLSMVLDVVYNHFGSVDNFAARYVPEWFDEDVQTPWGPGIDVAKEWVRKFYYENAVMWLTEFGFDGLRFDAIHEIKTSGRHQFLGELAEAARTAKPDAALIVENMNNSTRWLERDAHNEPMSFRAQWNEDIHHVLAFITTGEGNKTGYDDPDKDPIADLEKALADGFVHDRSEGPDSDGRVRGGFASRLPPDSFITYVENHDQIGNRVDGQRLSSRIEPRQMDFLHFVKFIAPHIPLCFMGDEANLTSPFPFFVDFETEDGDAADQRRYKEMREIFNEDVPDGGLPHPNDPATFEKAKLPWEAFGEEDHRAALERFRQLAGYRRDLVWPLTATPCRESRSARHDQGIIVSWEFEAGTLNLALNPSAHALDMPCALTGVPLSTGSFDLLGDVLRLGPWSAVAWRS